MLRGKDRPRVLVARLDSAGDVLLSGPAVRAVAASGARVSYLCSPRGAQAARLLPGVDEVLENRAPWIDAHPEPATREVADRLIGSLCQAEPDEMIIFTSWHQSPLPLALLARMVGVPRISAISVDYPGSLLDVRHRVDDDLHEVERNLSLAKAAGYPLPAGDHRGLEVVSLRGRPPWLPDRYVAVHPGAAAPARTWSPKRFGELVAFLADTGQRVVVTGGPDETVLTAQVCGAHLGTPSVMDLGGGTDLAALAAVLAGADMLVTGNTGPAHLAAAVGTPVVSIYPPTVPAERWRPWMVPYKLVGDQGIACRGCRAVECPVPGHPCVDQLAVEDVLRAMRPLFPDYEDVPA